ncbi:KIF13A [Symbiodinium natans]|uniref:KIF13A protein n=1 Tax=Symbiodinium natans TaxID=878477 RepID=A0A812USL7_9DINO|nr:KIF13A [Symbiodinium natans]
MADADVGTTTVQVAVRVRPLSEKEIKEGGVECVEVAKDNTVTLHQENQPPNVFAFDNVFGKDSTQPEVFEMLGNPLLDKAFEGYNATIFAYGQTGSGKTHTMMADRKSDDRGLVPRISDNLFQRVSKLSSETRKFLICCSFLEIYNEIVYDLLVPRGKNTPKTGLEIREGKGIGVYVKDLQEIVVDSSEKVLKLIDQGFEHRATAATQMNATSSRSHCLFIIKMHQKDEQNAGNNNFSKMNLVDLAGSERASRTGAQGDTLKEGANINKSLSALGNVINALSTMASGNKKVFIPYRNSKLTRVLQESLGGNALTTMMAALSPSRTNADESLSTLNYAKRAKTIKVNATKNDEAEQIAKLEEEVEALRAKLAEQASGVADTSRYETQLQEMESFMKQTWEDKERQSQEHEEERKRLEQEAQRTVERLHEERKRRIRLLEEKGDLELTVQELKGLQGGDRWTPCTSSWPSQISRLLSLENRVTAQCRAACLLKEAVTNDVEHWCEKRRQVQEGGKEEDGGAGLRMLLHQAERKVGTMMREFESLAKQEQELAAEVALWMPQVQRVVAGIALESSEEKEEKTEEGGAASEVSEEYNEVLGLVLRQVDNRRMKVWGQIAEDHKALGDFVGQFQSLVDCSRALGADVAELEEETRLELEVGGSSSSRARPLALHGEEASAALSMPLGLAAEELPDANISASSNQQACNSVRLFSGVNRMKCAFSGWSPATDAASEYLQVDLGKPTWVSSLALQGRRPLCGDWEATRPLLAELLDPGDPLPPSRIFKRPPVRLIHDIVVAAHGRHQALAAGKPDFSAEQLDYKQLQNADRQAKVDFFELLLAKAGHALKGAGLQDKVAPMKVSPSDILGGKNTVESNRLLQLLCYLGLRKKLEGSSGGLLDVSDQWVTKFTVSWSEKGQEWAPLTAQGESSPFVFEGCMDPETVRFIPLGTAQPPRAVRFLRICPQEWQSHPSFRLEVFGWADGKIKVETPIPPSLRDSACRLDVVRRRAQLLQRCLALASAATAERWREAQRAEEERAQQAMQERTQVEQQLQETMAQLEEMRKAFNLLQDQVAQSEQKLADAEAEKLRMGVEQDSTKTQVQSLEEKYAQALEDTAQERDKVRDLEAKTEELKSTNEDLQQQIGVLTEERDVARGQEVLLFDTLAAKEEELLNTNEGYCYLTDQLNELKDEYAEKVDECDRTIESLNEQNKKLLDEGLKLRQELGDAKRRVADAEKAVQRAEAGLPVTFRVDKKDNGAGIDVPSALARDREERGASPTDIEIEGGEGEYQEDFEDE